ncbi:hypothetical protein D5018_03925 [Parashewanella curva]|uniref:Primosomal replication protein PriB/PriC domain protein n=1 Tax=Parashewanella curva TaxID=2338552 RepID=A0A3L8Q1X2_9GAMM|nr:hypothetical protein [Parashewanella curva]RLV60999.1 hypothetical protein D5018_03925 [Parashewanella curva]
MLTTEQKKKMLEVYLQAEIDVLAGKTTEVNGKKMTSEDLPEIRKGRIEWERKLAATQSKNSGFSLATF